MKYTIFTIMTLLLFVGCMPKDTPAVKKQVISKEQNTSTVITPPPPPKKEIELKEVEDTNYNDAYMYPQAPVKKENIVQPASAPIATGSTMGKQECIAMISQEKFDKYTAMFGSEDASIKRCNMIKSMNQ